MSTERKIKRNAIRCNFCGKELESTHVHDYRTHACEKLRAAYPEHPDPGIMVDGGREYLRRGYVKQTDYTEISEYHDASTV